MWRGGLSCELNSYDFPPYSYDIHICVCNVNILFIQSTGSIPPGEVSLEIERVRNMKHHFGQDE